MRAKPINQKPAPAVQQKPVAHRDLGYIIQALGTSVKRVKRGGAFGHNFR